MLDVGGQDATEAFEDVGHSDEAREILEGLLVGKLKRQVWNFSTHIFSTPNLFCFALGYTYSGFSFELLIGTGHATRGCSESFWLASSLVSGRAATWGFDALVAPLSFIASPKMPEGT